MARFLLGAIVTSIAGSIGGTTFRRTQHGLVCMNKQQVQKRSSLNSNSRISQIASIIKRWSSLDISLITAWNNAALLFEFKDKFGFPVYYSGRELFIKCNTTIMLFDNYRDDPNGINNTLEDVIIQNANFNVSENKFDIELNQALIKCKLFIQVELIRNTNTALQVSSNKVIFIADTSNGTNFGIDKQVNEYLGTIARDTFVRVIYQIVNDWGFRSLPMYIDVKAHA